jgi:transcriptional regulator NrdR family protein
MKDQEVSDENIDRIIESIEDDIQRYQQRNERMLAVSNQTHKELKFIKDVSYAL